MPLVFGVPRKYKPMKCLPLHTPAYQNLVREFSRHLQLCISVILGQG